VASRLELELERLYLRLLLPEMRQGRGGASKRYAGLTEVDGREEVVFVGLVVVRRDWTELAHRVQRELYERLFRQRPVEEFLRGVARQLKAGELDELLVYRKALRKPLDEYTETTPAHVAAARKRSRRPRRRISYVWTVSGPEPADERASPYDYDHYLDRQMRPVAEPVLRVLDLDFDEVVVGRKQLELF
jgi:DNA polymerase-2